MTSDNFEAKPIKVGDRVIKKEDAWSTNTFDDWGRGIGVGIVVEPPFPIDDLNEVDVKWPAGRCFEPISGLVHAPSKEKLALNHDTSQPPVDDPISDAEPDIKDRG